MRWVYLCVLNDRCDEMRSRLSRRGALWDVTQCPTVDRNQRFGEKYFLIFRVEKNFRTLKVEAAGSSETLLPAYRASWRHMPETEQDV
jgi:hypothetical protein